MKTKRAFLRGFVVSAAALVANAFSYGRVKPAEARGDDLEGTWSFRVTLTGLPPQFPTSYSSLVTFTGDGAVVQTAWIPPGVTGPISGVSPWLGQGEWVRGKKKGFLVTVLIPRFTDDGQFLGLAKTRSELTLDHTRREITGTYVFDALDPHGHVVLTGFGGAVHATRLVVEGP